MTRDERGVSAANTTAAKLSRQTGSGVAIDSDPSMNELGIAHEGTVVGRVSNALISVRLERGDTVMFRASSELSAQLDLGQRVAIEIDARRRVRHARPIGDSGSPALRGF